jgi:hypothetical protein
LAKKAEQQTFEATPERLYRAAILAIGELGYTILHSDAAGGTISFNTGRSMKSWGGQDLSATIVPGEGPTISRMLVGGSLAKGGMPIGGGAQIGAWGEKKALTRKFFEAVTAALPTVPEPAQAATGGAGQEKTIGEQIAALAELHSGGSLTDSEFAAAKARLLG